MKVDKLPLILEASYIIKGCLNFIHLQVFWLAYSPSPLLIVQAIGLHSPRPVRIFEQIILQQFAIDAHPHYIASVFPPYCLNLHLTIGLEFIPISTYSFLHCFDIFALFLKKKVLHAP